MSNGLVALSGALLCQYQGFADVNMGRGAIVIGLAAVIIGEAICSAQHLPQLCTARCLLSALGAIIYYIVIQLVIWLWVSIPDLLKLLSASVVAVFLGRALLEGQDTSRSRVKKAEEEATNA